ncbi:cytochrome d1 heme region [hydrothermal vent metagenome]|uniref:Cytochrome d1 heme region n=1 Tax=hydrothermal vent metagenome TaxID=652676 RepID=A0A1W1BRJ5_9ZZZZ
MRQTITLLSAIIFITMPISLFGVSGKKVFETYCWGCHHQTAVAFGPHFQEIASKRDASEIRAMIIDPASVSKILGYKRNAMPSFKLKEEELKAITDYILSYKPDNNISSVKDN